jgi:hypothetical protein
LLYRAGARTSPRSFADGVRQFDKALRNLGLVESAKAQHHAGGAERDVARYCREP